MPKKGPYYMAKCVIHFRRIGPCLPPAGASPIGHILQRCLITWQHIAACQIWTSYIHSSSYYTTTTILLLLLLLLLNYNKLHHPRRRLRDRCCLSFCNSVSHSFCKSNPPFHWNLVLWLGLPVYIYQSEELINFWWRFGPGYGFWITFPLLSPLQNRGF